MKLIADCMFRKNVIGFGIDIGVNKFRKTTPRNIFIEMYFLFWTFGIELTLEE